MWIFSEAWARNDFLKRSKKKFFFSNVDIFVDMDRNDFSNRCQENINFIKMLIISAIWIKGYFFQKDLKKSFSSNVYII